MNKDNEIDELFKSYQPEVNTDRIMKEISSKMDVIDMVRSEHEQVNRFHRAVSICCFIVGLLTGCILMSMVLLHPFADIVLSDLMTTDNRFPEFSLFCTDHRDMILIFLAAASFILGSLPLINTNEWNKSL